MGGVINALTAGLASRLVGAVWSLVNAVTGISLSSLVNTSSSAYAAGGVAGQVLGLVLMAVPGLGGALMAVQAVGMGLNAADAFARGDTQTGFLDLEGALLAGVGAAEAAEAAEGSVAAAEGMPELEGGEAPALNEGYNPNEMTGPVAVPQLEGSGTIAAGNAGTWQPAESMPDLGGNSPYQSAVGRSATSELPQEGVGDYEDNTSLNDQCEAGEENCFTAETQLVTRWGLKLIALFRQGDRLLSRSENDPEGPVVERLVTAVYTHPRRSGRCGWGAG